MRIQLALFAKFAALHGEGGGTGPTREIDVPDGYTVGDVVRDLGIAAEPRITFVNNVHANDDTELHEGDRLALFPPIAGG